MTKNLQTTNIEIGNIGENAACDYLRGQKYKILFRNQKEGFDEIDIIARSSKGTLVFIEVKTLHEFRDSSLCLSPEDQLTFKKLYKISRGCTRFAAKHPDLIDNKKGWRIDLIAINLGNDKNEFRIRHYENILG